MLLVPGAVRSLDNEIRRRESADRISLHDVDLLEHLGRLLGIEEWRLLFVLDLDVRGVEALPILVREQQNRLRHVPHLALDEKWLVLLDQIYGVASDDVAVVDDGETGGVEVEADGPHAAARNRRANGAAVDHAGESDVVRVPRASGGLSDPILAGDAVTDCWHVRSRPR